VIVFDVTNMTSFKNCTKWINFVKDRAEPNCLMVLVGNKTDMCLPATV